MAKWSSVRARDVRSWGWLAAVGALALGVPARALAQSAPAAASGSGAGATAQATVEAQPSAVVAAPSAGASPSGSASAAPSASPTVATSPPAETDELLPAPGRVGLRLHSVGTPLRISRVVPGVDVHANRRYEVETPRTREVCSTPCTLYVRPGPFSFEVTGAGVSGYSVTSEAPGELVLRTPSAIVGGLGAGALVVGGIGALVGTALLVGDAVQPRAAGAGGIALVGAGGALLVTGAVMIGVNRGGVAERRAFSAQPQPTTARIEWGVGLASAWARF